MSAAASNLAAIFSGRCPTAHGSSNCSEVRPPGPPSPSSLRCPALHELPMITIPFAFTIPTEQPDEIDKSRDFKNSCLSIGKRWKGKKKVIGSLYAMGIADTVTQEINGAENLEYLAMLDTFLPGEAPPAFFLPFRQPRFPLCVRRLSSAFFHFSPSRIYCPSFISSTLSFSPFHLLHASCSECMHYAMGRCSHGQLNACTTLWAAVAMAKRHGLHVVIDYECPELEALLDEQDVASGARFKHFAPSRCTNPRTPGSPHISNPDLQKASWVNCCFVFQKK